MQRQRLDLLVDAARFFLFHPKDCAEAAGELDPPDEAFQHALVVGLQLGGDGPRAVEVTDTLDETDRADVDGEPFVFPLRVVHGKLYATDRVAGMRDYDWEREPHAAIPPGTYAASWYLLRSDAIARRGVNWLLHLEPAETLVELATWDELPHEEAQVRRPVARTQSQAQRRVHHAKFGGGSVVSRSDDKLTVDFDDGQRRTIAERFLTLLP